MAKTKTVASLGINLQANTAQYTARVEKAKVKTRQFTQVAKGANDANRGMASSVSNLSNKVAILQGPLGGTAGRLSSLASGLKSVGPAGVAAGLGVTALTFAMAKSIAVFGQYEESQLKIEALIKATGSASGFTANQLTDLADKTAAATLASVEGSREAIGVLLTFKSVQGEQFKQAIALSQDMAAVMTGTMATNAKQLGKALEDPTIGLTALNKSGITFNEIEKEKIKSLQKSNRLHEAQALILDKVKGQVGGAGAAASGGLSGAFDLLGQRVDEFGLALARTTGAGDATTKMINRLADGVEGLNKKLSPPDETRMNELLRERIALQKRLNRAKEGSGAARGLNLLLTDNSKEMAAIQERNKNRIIADQKAVKAAEAARLEAIRQGKENTRLKLEAKQKEQSQKEFDTLVQQQKTKAQKLEEGYQKQQDLILANTVAGSAKQAELMQSIDEQYFQQSLALSQQRADQVQQQEDTRLQTQAEQLRLRREQEIAEARGFNSVKEMEEQGHQDRILNIKKDQEEKAAAYRMQTWQVGLNGLSSNMNGMLALMKQGGKEQTGLYKTLFVLQKAVAIASMTVSTLQAANNARANAPTPASGETMAAIVMATGFANVALAAGTAIAGVAHGGMDYIPSESTFLLDKGERVLSPRQNSDLTSYLANQKPVAVQGNKAEVNITFTVSESTDEDFMVKVMRNRGDITNVINTALQQVGGGFA